MILDPQACYQAITTRDPRFDGRVFVGVSSTRIYCRPICRAKRPKMTNCSFFSSAAAAEVAGFRPCLLCRPELAPGNAAVDASARLAQQAAGLIEDGTLTDARLDQLAFRLGVTARHLRRVFKTEFGVSPVAFAQTQRLLLAKRLLTDTQLPMTEIAFACGFGSLRRFNALFHERYRLNPTALRKQTGTPHPLDAFDFQLAYRPPLDWTALLAFLARRAVAGVEQVDDDTYYRTLRIEQGGNVHAGWVAAAPLRAKHALEIGVSSSLSKVLPLVLARAKGAFDLSCDPQAIAAGLGGLAAGRAGLRVPGSWDGFELLARTILGQQVTVGAARTLANRLVETFGEPLDTPRLELSRLFPTAARIAQVEPSDIAALGVVRSRARALVGVARAVAAGELSVEPGADVERTLATLRNLPGIGEWTAQYVLMRGLSWPDAFLPSDRGVLRAMHETDPRRALARAADWQPWRSYAVIHLWRMLEE
jgi:AraC family transcriptional regulator of adaptative response / DNA-3-methyladenine glycosylase II